MGSSPTTLELKLEKATTSSRSQVFGTVTTQIGLLQTIPPERVGLNGEYDHSGLAKRVQLAFQQTFSSEQIQALSVSQRGRVVVLKGRVSQGLLQRLVEIAAKIHGATDVETYAVTSIEE
ncbi:MULTISPECIES: phospholipid-binding protein [Trichocoleus]|uniref:BON domain-containing protein n=1 Tax=Trichocoleus desertorum GB2-A4 TaxID=2933944 RepID=A0ABV0J8Q2_9CYAN|nr:phospholipid-binding protein [Trichocoleus sp. FACHB-46]MBD1862590.1 phospholipid-binding protein [Trichocoleus sp. FACHB-46]